MKIFGKVVENFKRVFNNLRTSNTQMDIMRTLSYIFNNFF